LKNVLELAKSFNYQLDRFQGENKLDDAVRSLLEKGSTIHVTKNADLVDDQG
jgi:hypothetical protein